MDQAISIMRKLIARFPVIEVLYRHIYWRMPFVPLLLKKLRDRRKPVNRPRLPPILQEFSQMVQQMGIKQGDVLIVHSAMGKFYQAGHSVQEILDLLFDLVGPSGTIVMLAIPILRDDPDPKDRFNDSLFANPFVYNKGVDKIWTGRLPKALCDDPQSYLSSMPLNTVVAKGAHAQEIVEEQNMADGFTACGPGSAWARCYELNAKILMVDVDVAHSLTMIHTAEDLFEAEWPIKNWYRPRDFVIQEEGHKLGVQMRERHPKWALFYCEFRFNRDLRDQSIFVYETTDNGLKLALGTSKGLIDFLRSHRPGTYPYVIPKFIGKRVV
ncbi:AAC(3) family N-acetyltransferase [Ascidiaceihabitans sp.]|nr:AAC(3) family N-acetyltransferase [Ascidiaceihabitans sp.]MDA9136418.1 AAC(3) family N-acetyltransferase [Ascidiaceihabitans sp.]